ncbi:MAG: hypothetical protein ABWY18_15920 [Tardiphaga sp.]
MSVALDGFAVLRRVGMHADAFAPVRADADKAVRALVVKCLRAKSVGIEALRDIRRALGDDAFDLLLDGMKDAEITPVLTRLDKHFAALKSGSVDDRSRHLKALAHGSIDPVAAPAKPVKKTAVKKAKTATAPARLRSEVMDLFREGGNKRRSSA